MSNKKNVVVFATGSKDPKGLGGSGLLSYIHTLQNTSDMQTNIACIVSDCCGGSVTEIAKEYDIPFLFLPKYSSKAGQITQMIIKLFSADLVVLWGYMSMLKGVDSRHAINVHPGKIPDTAGLCGHSVHSRVIELREEYISGLTDDDVYQFSTALTFHFVLPEVYDSQDDTSVVSEYPMEVYRDDTVKSLERRVKKEEHAVYPLIIESILHTPCKKYAV